MSPNAIKTLADMLSEQCSDFKECIGVATPLSLDFVVAGKVSNSKITGVSLSVDEMGRLLDATLYVPHSKDALRTDGKAHAGELIKKATANVAEPTEDLPVVVGYPYFDNACHNDCADFVSQAMHEGGIPIDPGKWERLLDGDYGWTWTHVPALEDYMVGEGYWDASNYANCNAGNILLTSSSHIVMVVLNDSVTHRYSGHTRDRYYYQFTDSSGYVYYTIKTT